jgi:hypothetical protein
VLAAAVEMRAVAVAAKAHVATRVIAAMVAAVVLVEVVVASKHPAHKVLVLPKVADVAPWATHSPAAMKVVLPGVRLNHAHHGLLLALNPTRCAPASI